MPAVPRRQPLASLARAFAEYDGDAERRVDGATDDERASLERALEKLGRFDAIERMRRLPSQGTFYFRSFTARSCNGPAEWLTVDRSGVVWAEQRDPMQGGEL